MGEMLPWVAVPSGVLAAYLRLRRDRWSSAALPLFMPLVLLVGVGSTLILEDGLSPWRLAGKLFLVSWSASILIAKAWLDRPPTQRVTDTTAMR